MPQILNIIHLPHRDDRLQSFMIECNIQNIAFNVWDGITTYQQPYRNISLAHKQIVKKAHEEKWPYAIIAEDDIKFSSPGAWKYYLSQMPSDFDLYCGLMYHGVTDENNRIIKGMSGTNTLYTIHQRFYEFFLMIDELRHLDRELGKFATLNKYILCKPMVCYQMGGISDNFKREMSYENYLIGKKLFGQ